MPFDTEDPFCPPEISAAGVLLENFKDKPDQTLVYAIILLTGVTRTRAVEALKTAREIIANTAPFVQRD